MRAIRLKQPGGLDHLFLDTDSPRTLGAGDIRVRLHASSLNYHDYIVAIGRLPAEDGRIPMSDGAGEVIEVGAEVRQFAVGDSVISTFFPEWLGGPPGDLALPEQRVPGDSIDGYAREEVVAPATYFTRAPVGYSHAEAATLICAGLTAWRALFVEAHLRPGQTVLVQGTGGVSVFALQLAKACGARVIATSSSAEKLSRLRALGADHVINYREEPDWGAAAREQAGGSGVDHVVEIGGAGTLEQSIKACRVGGHIALIGVLAGYSADIPIVKAMFRQLHLSGITVGSRTHQEEFVRAVEAAGIRPVIDRSFPLERLADAFRYQESGQHLGKICVEW
jgi:NADPH:quinone reductase-like Zn-dependent oxidoreductase